MADARMNRVRIARTRDKVGAKPAERSLMLVVYVLLLGALALFTAYVRNFQHTIVAFGSRLEVTAGARLISRGQRLRTAGVLAGWPLAVGIGLLFVAWWKAVALVVGAFLILVPALGVLTPPPESRHYVARIRDDLRRRIASGGRDVTELRGILERLDQITRTPPT